ncbi:anti-sigma-V factor RsiV [Clostridium acetireducens DSM 10703]|uniref:Anti-sigma-V factor RsiV n=1 Tax=Clostridium acetireducens DSM 10703 TaxID=1121290 RepID=A0A1E8EYD2_9CLOT|nr:anti-sigma-V factor RsiV [Clostridium acetireducens DSM 10703]
MWREICLNNFVKMYLPFTAEIIVLEEPYKKLAIFYCDLDKDGIKEIVAAYTWQGENYIIVLKNQYNSWYMVENKKTNNYREILSNIINKENNLYAASIKTVKGVKWGYINDKGNLVIKPEYDFALDFQENGLAIIEIGGFYGIINKEGKYIVEPKYYSISEFSEGRASVIDEEGFKVIDEKGKVITSKPYNYIAMYREGRALFGNPDKEGNYLYGYLDRQGKEVIPAKYEFANNFNKGKAVVKVKEKEYALIGINGEVLNTYAYYYVGDLRDGLLPFQANPEYKYGYIDESGNVVIKPQYVLALPFSEGRAVINNSENYINKYGVIDKTGKFVIEPKYNYIDLLGENRITVGKAIDEEKPYIGSKYAIFDTDGNSLTDFIYYGVSNYNKGLASAFDNKYTFFIDLSGKKVNRLPSVQGVGILYLKNNIIKSDVDFRVSYLDTKGNIIWQQNTIIPLNNKYSVQEKKYRPNRDYLVYYPEVKGMEDKNVQENVNKKLKELSQIIDIPDNVQIDYNYFGDFNIEFFKNKLLVLEINGYKYYFGAAHGMPTKIYAHIDLTTGKFYELKDLFKEGSNYVEVLNKIIDYEIKNNEDYYYVYPDGFKSIKPNQPFYVDEENLYIYFYPYEIAPYAAGFPTFKIPFNYIMNIINTKGNFWKSFNKS